MLRCIACHRPMESAAVTVERAGRVGHYGPKCAAKAGLLSALPKAKKPRGALICSSSRKPKKDDRQMPLELEIDHETA